MSDSEEIHPIFTKDPDEWLQYVYKQVSVLTEDGTEHVGLVYTVDPVSESFVLVTFNDDRTKVEIVVGSSITSVTVLSDNTELHRDKLDGLFRPTAHAKLTEEELRQKQGLLKSWLLKNRLPVEVMPGPGAGLPGTGAEMVGGGDGELLSVAGGALIVQPPYGAENCVSTNEIILGKIQGLIKNMPPDHDQW